MYGLPQAGLLAQELLEKRLNEKVNQLNSHWWSMTSGTNMWEKKQHSSLLMHYKNITQSLWIGKAKICRIDIRLGL
ncbi:hypothetical protein ACHAW6_004255 [Cyclotella cf. meneghiniana]